MSHRLAGFILLSILALAALVPVTAAMAQVPAGTCNGSGSIPGTYKLTPDAGPAGTTTTVTGLFPLSPVLRGNQPAATGEGPVPDTVQQGGLGVQIFWVETPSGAPQQVGQFDLTLGNNEASFSGQIVIPANAAPGPHEVELWLTTASDPNCLTFTVTQSVQQTAYTQTATNLPHTGSVLYVPLAGLAAGGTGVLILVRRARTACRKYQGV